MVAAVCPREPNLSRHWSCLALNGRSGSEVFAALFSDPVAHPLAALLESPTSEGGSGTAQLARYSICAGAPYRLDGQPRLWTPEVGEILAMVRSHLTPANPQLSGPQLPAHLPFKGGYLGWFGYDLAWEIEQLPQLREDELPFPVACWYEPDQLAVLDHHTQQLWLAASDPTALTQLTAQLAVRHPLPSFSGHTDPPQFANTQAAFEQAVGKIKSHIAAGDIFQANFSLRFQTHTTAQPLAIYHRLQQINPSPFAAYWRTPWGHIVSCSPERLVQLQARQAQTRPIAGTRPRGTTPPQDQQLARELLANPKENAEHTMLVDLERNDLGRVCKWGSVQVDEFCIVERYSHVMHLVSNVVGQLAASATTADLVAALFPGGTITGCPKVRCMEIIETLEPVRRSLFYGSCGYLDWQGNLDLNILIRTLLMAPLPTDPTAASPATRSYAVWGQVGAGIVADSHPTQEWLESLQKARAQLLALGL
ncbi:MAG: anthranilate synthase component I [Cyanobacteria bacterium P01_A01_bin.105]